MRTKRMIDGLDNNQKIRFIVNGFSMFCRVKDTANIADVKYRVAVQMALVRIGTENWLSKRTGKEIVTGYGTNYNGVDVQVDLCDDSTYLA